MNAVIGTTRARETYDPHAMEARWRAVWDRLSADPAAHPAAAAALGATRDDGERERRYLLTMFPYPSGDLHMGHGEVFAIEDMVARYWRHRGYDVMNPIGWDSFGLPAENAAIRRGEHPAVFTYANIETQAASIRRYAMTFDWSRRLHTSDPEYHRWTQWLFLRLHERGLAYRRASWVNWCPADRTVLANEQVVGGHCERCGAEVTKRRLTQWYFRITAYAQRLLDDMDQLAAGWPQPVLSMQRNWIGRSEGAYVDFAVDGRAEPVRVFTTRPDTLAGATFFVVAPDAALAAELCGDAQRPAFEAFLADVQRTSEIERQAVGREPRGVPLGVHALNPLTCERIPVWAADYVLADYGTGAVMAVPAHDERDRAFAAAYDLPVREVVGPGEPDPVAIAAAVERLQDSGSGEPAVTYRLRDWLVSRQRYWGAPIPIVHCPACGEVRVPDDELPLTLPDLRGDDLRPQGVSPLAGARDWVETTCPACGGPAERDTDTTDTFVDSSWYQFRYCSPGYEGGPFRAEEVERWMPIPLYVGGGEHAVLHLLYMRFLTKALHDLGLVPFTEPTTGLINQGQVVNQGRSMSKSLGNGVDLGEQLDAYGVDAVRLTMIFSGPPADDIDWADVSPGGSLRFLQRAWRLAGDVTSAPGTPPDGGDVALRRVTHRTVAEAERLLDAYRLNVVVARTMELVNATRAAIETGPGPADPAVREAAETAALLLGLTAPYTAEDMWARLGHEPTIAARPWPVTDPALVAEETVTCVVQVAGKVRARLDVRPSVSEAELERRALAAPGVERALAGRPVARVVVRAPRLVNVVPG